MGLWFGTLQEWGQQQNQSSWICIWRQRSAGIQSGTAAGQNWTGTSGVALLGEHRIPALVGLWSARGSTCEGSKSSAFLCPVHAAVCSRRVWNVSSALTGAAENVGHGQVSPAQPPRGVPHPTAADPTGITGSRLGTCSSTCPKASLGSWATPQGTLPGPQGLC